MLTIQLESELLALPMPDKLHLLQVLVADLTHTWPGIEKSPDIAGGAACIIRTRIPVWSLAGYRRFGWSEERILSNFPTLRPADLRNAWAYVAAHPGEIEQAIRENEEA